MISNLIVSMAHKCKFCDKEFARENTLAVHMCEPKRRFNQQNDTGVRLGFQTYLKFYEMTQGNSKSKTYEDFSRSPYYKAFVKYGWYCVSIRAINIPRFTDWLLKNNKKLDNWTKDSFYGEYLHEYLRIEAVGDALARAIEFSIDWANKNESPPHDCLRYGNTNAICYAITTGRLSAWVIYNSESGQKFLSELNEEQIAIVWPFIDADYWNRRFKDYPADQMYAQEILQKAGW